VLLDVLMDNVNDCLSAHCLYILVVHIDSNNAVWANFGHDKQQRTYRQEIYDIAQTRIHTASSIRSVFKVMPCMTRAANVVYARARHRYV
jgi:hypothetical protein